jgi:hypothetical protein
VLLQLVEIGRHGGHLVLLGRHLAGNEPLLQLVTQEKDCSLLLANILNEF